jgi:hypothetical protein
MPGDCQRRFNRSPDQIVVVEIDEQGRPVLHDEWKDRLLTGPD